MSLLDGHRMINFSLSKKIILVSSVSIALSAGIALLVQSTTMKSQGIELTRNTMRAAVTSAESMRISISAMRARSSFDDAALRHRASGRGHEIDR